MYRSRCRPSGAFFLFNTRFYTDTVPTELKSGFGYTRFLCKIRLGWNADRKCKHSHCEAKFGLRVWSKFVRVRRDAHRIWASTPQKPNRVLHRNLENFKTLLNPAATPGPVGSVS